MPRHWLTSILHEGAMEAARVVISPLAQIFQSVMIDERILGEAEQPHDATSYGPVSRRRGLSTALRPATTSATYALQGGALVQSRRFPSGGDHLASPGAFSESTEQNVRVSRNPPMAGQI